MQHMCLTCRHNSTQICFFWGCCATDIIGFPYQKLDLSFDLLLIKYVRLSAKNLSWNLHWIQKQLKNVLVLKIRLKKDLQTFLFLMLKPFFMLVYMLDMYFNRRLSFLFSNSKIIFSIFPWHILFFLGDKEKIFLSISFPSRPFSFGRANKTSQKRKQKYRSQRTFRSTSGGCV